MNKILKTLLLYAMVAVLCALTWGLTMGIYGYAPFGGTHLLRCDNMNNIAVLNGGLEGLCSGARSLYFSLLSGGVPSHSFVPTAMETFFPASLLAFLASPVDLQAGISWTILFQAILAAWACYFYLSRTFRRVPMTWLCLLSYAYAYSRLFFLVHTACCLYTPVILFPIFLYALDRLLKRGKWGLYLAVMAYMVAGCTYYAWMYGLFATLYALCYMGGHAGRRRVLPAFVLSTAGALVLAAVAWFPSLFVVAASDRASFEVHWFDGSLTPDSVDCWLLAPVAVALLLLSVKRWRVNRFLPCMFVLALCLLWRPLNQIWHVGVPAGAPGRFGYMLTMMGCAYAASVCRAPRAVMDKRRLMALCGLVVWVGASCICGWFYGKECLGCDVLVYTGVALCAVIPCALLLRRAGVWISFACCMAAVVFCTGTCYYRTQEEGKYVQRTGRELDYGYKLPLMVADRLSEQGVEDRLSFRVGGKGLFIRNFAEYAGLLGISNDFHTMPAHNQRAFDCLGYTVYYTTISDSGGTLFSDSFLGFRYMGMPVYHDALTPLLDAPDMGNARVCVNPYFWGMGVVCKRPEQAPDPEKQDVDKFEYHNAFFQALGGKGDILQPLEGVQEIRSGKKVSAKLPKGTNNGFIYTDLPMSFSGWAEKSRVTVADPSLITFNKYRRNIPLGMLTSRSGVVVYPNVNPAYADIFGGKCHFYRLDERKLADFAAGQKDRVKIQRMHRSSMKLAVSARGDEDYLVLPFHYLPGYSAEVNDGKVEVEDCMGFLGVPLGKAGDSTVELSYTMPGSTVGLGISACGLVLLAGGCALRRRVRIRLSNVAPVLHMGLLLMWGCLLLFPVACLVLNLFGIS